MTAARTGLTFAAVYHQTFGESAARPRRVAIVAKARPSLLDRLREDADDCITQQRRLFNGYTIRDPRRIDLRAPQCFICVDVADTGQNALIHQDLFRRLARGPKKSR